jgi:hypothetical protein
MEKEGVGEREGVLGSDVEDDCELGFACGFGCLPLPPTSLCGLRFSLEMNTQEHTVHVFRERAALSGRVNM